MYLTLNKLLTYLLTYPSNHSQEEADFEAHESNFHSLQQMDAKTTDVLEELKLKYGEGQITEDQICLKCGKNDSYSQGVY